MEDSLSTLLTLIPLAILIAVRMIGSKKKKAAAADRRGIVDMLVRAAEPPPRKAPPAPEEQFSAFALKPDDEEPARPVRSELRARRPLPAAAPDGPSPAEPAPVPAAEPAPEYYSAPKAPAQPASRDAVSARLERLPPLKRAVVFAELLGAPKSMN